MRRGRLFLIVCLALGLTACNGTIAPAPLPPFRVIGNWTGSRWRAIAPGLAGTLDPSSSNICESGKPACMDAVVGEMSRRIAALGCSHLAPFATMYRQVSAEIRASVDARRYVDPAYVAHLDGVFAVLPALDSWRAGRASTRVPRRGEWRSRPPIAGR